MEQDEFNAVSNLLQGLNSSGTLNPADLSILQNAILSVFSGTYRQPQVGKSTDDLIMDYAPDLFGAVDSEDLTRQEIAQMVMNGMDALSIKVKTRKLLNSLPSNEDSPLVEEYLSLVDTYKNQWQEFQKQERKNEIDKREADPFVKNGLPAFDERYQAQDVYADQFQKLASDYTKNAYVARRRYPEQKLSEPKAISRNRPDAPYSPSFPGESKAELDAIRKELIAKRVYDPNAEYRPYFPGESDADVRRIAQERQALKESATNDDGQVSTPKKIVKPKTVPFDEAKARLAGNSPERLARVAAAMVARLQTGLDASGNTPLKDALIQNSIFAAAANKPKASKASKANEKKYTVKGSNVVKLGK